MVGTGGVAAHACKFRRGEDLPTLLETNELTYRSHALCMQAVSQGDNCKHKLVEYLMVDCQAGGVIYARSMLTEQGYCIRYFHYGVANPLRRSEWGRTSNLAISVTNAPATQIRNFLHQNMAYLTSHEYRSS